MNGKSKYLRIDAQLLYAFEHNSTNVILNKSLDKTKF